MSPEEWAVYDGVVLGFGLAFLVAYLLEQAATRAQALRGNPRQLRAEGLARQGRMSDKDE